MNTTRWREMLGRSFEPRQWYEEKDWPDLPQQEERIMWVYRKLRNPVDGKESWAVGFYCPNREWNEDSRYEGRDEAADRVHWLNGGERA